MDTILDLKSQKLLERTIKLLKYYASSQSAGEVPEYDSAGIIRDLQSLVDKQKEQN